MPRRRQPVFRGIHDDAAISLVATNPDRRATVIDHSRDDHHARPRTEATMPLSSRPTSIAAFSPLRARAMSDAGSFQGRVNPQRCHSTITSATSRPDRCDRKRRGRGCRSHALEYLAGIHDATADRASALMARISSIATFLSLTSCSSLRLSTPMPCSAEIEPPIRSNDGEHDVVDSCHRPMKSAVVATDRLADNCNGYCRRQGGRTAPAARRYQLDHGRVGFRDEIGTAATGTEMSCLIEPPSGFCARGHLVAQLPEPQLAGSSSPP